MNRFSQGAAACLACVSFAATSALALDLEEYGDPATISFSADYAVITPGKPDRITLHGVSRLATVTAAMHKHNRRIFSAFPVSELPEAWNSCNAMKTELGMFHDDGVNSVVAFAGHSDGIREYSYLSKPTLLTQSQDIEVVSDDAAGAVGLMLIDAKYDGETLEFSVPNALTTISAETIVTDVIVSTECTFISPTDINIISGMPPPPPPPPEF